MHGRVQVDNRISSSETRSLRDVRAERLLSIRELAGRAGLSPSTVLSIESGRSIARPTSARSLAKALRVAPRDVVEFIRTIERYT